MDSLNPGKAVAQGAHAANVFAEQVKSSKFKKEYKKWAGDRKSTRLNSITATSRMPSSA